MSLLFRGERRMIDSSSLFSPEYGGSVQSMAGERVDWVTAIGMDTVAAAVGLLSDMAMMLPLQGFTDVGGTPTRLSPEAQIVADPSMTVDAETWRSQLIVSWALWGNAYGLITSRDRMEYPSSVEWLWPDRVQVTESSTLPGGIEYRLDGQPIPQDRIIHRPGRYVIPGSRLGLVPLERFRETFGLALAARNFGAKWFGDGAHPSSVLSTDSVLTPEDAKTMKDRFVAALRGRREPAVLGAGIKWTQVQVAPSESQFIETQQSSAVSVARVFGLPSDMIDAAVSGQSVTYANREQRAIDFLTFHADPWLVRAEKLVTSMMPTGRYSKFNRDALLRTDLLTRYKAHDISVRGGWHSVNRVLELEDEPSIGPDGDQHLWPPYSTTPIPEGVNP